MKEVQLRNRVGIFLIISHFGIMLSVIGIYLAGGFLFDEMTTTIALMAPFFASYTTVIVRFVIKNKYQTQAKSKDISGMFVFIGFLLPCLFIAAILAAIVLKALNAGFSSFEEFKTVIAIFETVFAVYVGQVVFSLFKGQPE